MRRRHANALLSTIVLAAALAACTFDPLAGWEPPQFGSVTLGDAITPGEDGVVGDVAPPPPPLAIESVDPERGDPAGDEPIVVRGSGFESGALVYFGEEPGVFPQAQLGERIFVRTPAHAPGVVDVRVVLPDGRETVRRDAFLFGRPVRIHDIEPAEGPAAGGTPVTVRGEGFLPDTSVLVGGRRLIAQRVVDDATVIGITPGLPAPGGASAGSPAGPADVIASNLVGVARLAGAFEYVAPVTLRAVTPFAGPAAGGNVVSLRGSGFTSAAVVRFGDEAVPLVDWAADGTSVGVVVPAGPVGAVAVEVTVPSRGGARIDAGYVRLRDDATAGSLTFGGLWPPEGDEAGGDAVTLAVSGVPVDGPAPSVQIGGQAATTLAWDAVAGRIDVRTPPGRPGVVDVVLQAGARSAYAPQAFRYLPSFRLTAVTPATGPTAGGTEVSLQGAGLGPGTRVWVGALAATDVRPQPDGTVRCVTPPGAPGDAAIRVERDDRSAVLPDAFAYSWGALALFAVQPSVGAIAGGTYVELFGADFPAEPQVRFGNRMATGVVRLSRDRVACYAPSSAAPRSVDVVVTAGVDLVSRKHGYTYFDPRGLGGGTWGGPIDGAVNVTVLQTRPVDPIPNAFVMLGTDPDTPYRGWTDENGQVTLSGPGLGGPRDVTATAVGYTASTVIRFDAANVTLSLVPDVPPSPGGGGGETLPNGAIAGRVEGVTKYVPVPRAPCDDKLDVYAPLCHPCAADEDCLDATGTLEDPACSNFGLEGGRCTSGCADTACPVGFACAPVDGAPRCVPSLGRRDAHCEISRRSPYWQAETAGADIGSDGYYYLESRLGEVAVVCLGGYEDWETGEFVPTRMGVKRHVFAESADVVSEQDVPLDIPLDRTVVFRLDPTHPEDGEPWETRLTVYLDFGPDGVLPLGEELGAAESGDVRLLRVPRTFTGTLFDAGLTVYAGRYSPDDLIDTPYSATYRERLADDDLAQPQVLVERVADDAGGAGDGDRAANAGGSPAPWAFEDIALARQPYAVWQAPDGVRFVVGEAGLLVRHTPGIGWTLQPSLGERGLNDLDGVDRSSVWVVGDGGAIFHHDGLSWQRLESPDDRDLRAVWAAGPDRFIAVGDHRIVEYDQGGWTVHKVTADLYGVSGHHWERVWAVGRDGALLVRTAAGWDRVVGPTEADLYAVWLSGESMDGYAVGAEGTVLRLDDGAWEAATLALDDPPRVALFDVQARSPQDVAIVGDDGVVLRFDGRTWRRAEGSARESSLRSVHAGEGGAWTAVGPRAVPLGPILPVLRFSEPREGVPWNGRHFRWTTGPGPQAGAAFFDIIGQTGGTRWSVLAPGHLDGFDLPDLSLAAGFSPVPPGTLRLRAQTAYWPTFDIDNVRSSGFTYSDWISWTYHYLVLE